MSFVRKLFGRNKKVESERVSEDRVINVGRMSRYFGLLAPDEVGRIVPKSLTLKDIKQMTASELLRTLISMSSDMDAAVTTFVAHCASKYSLKSSDDNAKMIIEDFIMTTELGDVPYETKIQTAFYNRYVEGGLLAELYADETGEFVDIALPPPFSLRYEEVIHPVHNRYYRVGQGTSSTDFKVLQDKANPNPLVEWAPTNKFPDRPYGRSQIASNIFGTVSLMEVANMVMDYVRGQARPGGVISVPRAPIAQAGYQPTEITKIAESAEEKIRKAMDSGDISQLITVPVEVIFETFTALGKSDVDASQVVVNMVSQQLRRGYKLPRALFGGTGERGSTLGDRAEETEWEAFDKIVQPERETVSKAFTNLHRQVLRSRGSMGEVELIFDPTDTKLERIRAEKFNIEYQGYSTLIKDRVISPMEARTQLKKTNPAFKDLADEMEGDPFMATPAQPQGMEQPNE